MSEIKYGFPMVGVGEEKPFRQAFGVSFQSKPFDDSVRGVPMDHALNVLALNCEDATMVAERWLNDQWPGHKFFRPLCVGIVTVVWKE